MRNYVAAVRWGLCFVDGTRILEKLARYTPCRTHHTLPSSRTHTSSPTSFNHEMHVIVTGAAGLIGSHVMVRLLEEGHSVTATDINPLPDVVTSQLAPYTERVLAVVIGDLTKPTFVDELFDAASSKAPIDGVMHIGGIRSPVGLDPRLTHNINVTASYNVLQTAAARGIERVVQASSCNALGLSWTSAEHWGLDFLPINESHPMRPVRPVSYSSILLERTGRAVLINRKTRIVCRNCMSSPDLTYLANL